MPRPKKRGYPPIRIFRRLFGEQISVPMLDCLKDAIAVMSKDGRIMEINAAFVESFGVSKAVARGRDCRDIAPLGMLWNAVTSCLLYNKPQGVRIKHDNLTLEASITPVIEEGEAFGVCVLLRDVSPIVMLEEEFLKRNKELVISNTLASAFIGSMDMDSVFNDVLEKVLTITCLGMAWIMIIQDGEFVLKGASGVPASMKEAIEKSRSSDMFAPILKAGDPLYIIEPMDSTMPEFLRREGVVFLAAVPLRTFGEAIGVLVTANRVPVVMDFDFVSLMSIVGGNMSLIAEKIKFYMESQKLAHTDGLTGLYNTRYFYDALNAETARSARYDQPFSLAVMDVDEFRKINDSMGHRAGDEALRTIAGRIKAVCRGSDILSRCGGEEFIIILPNTEKDSAFALAQRVKEGVEKPMLINGQAASVNLTAGIASFPADAHGPNETLRAANSAMYAAKSAGKNRIFKYGEGK